MDMSGFPIPVMQEEPKALGRSEFRIKIDHRWGLFFSFQVL